ncbi:MAG: HisS family protein [bacterium]|nr:HisS family protein [bacterium]
MTVSTKPPQPRAAGQAVMPDTTVKGGPARTTVQSGRSAPRRVTPRRTVGAPLYTALPGVRDLLPRDAAWWHAADTAIAAVAELHQCLHIDPPPLEPIEVYEAAFATEEVPYVIRTKSMRLVPQLDPRVAVLRSVLEHHVSGAASPLKLWYASSHIGQSTSDGLPLSATRVRGLEFIGDADPLYDGEAIAAAADIFRSLKVPDLRLVINTIGCRVCRTSYQQRLGAYYRGVRAKLCRNCVGRLDTAPLALLGCVGESCRELREHAPILLDYLCQNCNNHFRSVLEFVEENGILYEPNPYLIGPASYHTRTVFMFVSDLAAHTVGPPDRTVARAGTPSPAMSSRRKDPEPVRDGLPLAAGGRYDYLGEALRMRQIPAVGVTIYLEPLITLLRAENIITPSSARPAVFFVAIGDQARKSSLRLMQLLRAGGIPVAESVGKKSLLAQLRVAEKLKSTIALLYGQREAFEGTVIMRDLKTSAQETILITNLVSEIKKRFKS